MSRNRGQTGLPADTNKALQSVIGIINQLYSVYEKETEALNAYDGGSFMSMQNEKVDMANKYQSSIAELINRKAEITNASPVLKQELREMQQKFSDMTQENLAALQRMHRISERLGQTIHRAAKNSIKKQNGRRYSESGTIQEDKRRSISMGVSETA